MAPGVCQYRIFTFATPSFTISNLLAAARVRSIIRPRTKGPRSLIFTLTVLPFARFVTFTLVPNGSFLCAAVRSEEWYVSPFAVFLPL